MPSVKAYHAALSRRAAFAEHLPDVLWSTQQTAAYLGIVESTLWRLRRGDPHFPPGIALGKRKLSFSRRAVFAYVQAKLDAQNGA